MSTDCVRFAPTLHACVHSQADSLVIDGPNKRSRPSLASKARSRESRVGRSDFLFWQRRRQAGEGGGDDGGGGGGGGGGGCKE